MEIDSDPMEPESMIPPLTKPSSNNRELFIRRQRIVRVREIVEQLGGKHKATPKLIMDAMNEETSNECDRVSLLQATHYLHRVIYILSRKPHYSSSLSRTTQSFRWRPDRIRRLRYVVWKLGGVDRATPEAVLEAMRINHDDDYYLTVEEIRHGLSSAANRLSSEQEWARRNQQALDSMFPAPLVDDDETLSRRLADQLSLVGGVTASTAAAAADDARVLSIAGSVSRMAVEDDLLGGSGGPIRQARRRSRAINQFKHVDVVDDFRALTL